MSLSILSSILQVNKGATAVQPSLLATAAWPKPPGPPGLLRAPQRPRAHGQRPGNPKITPWGPWVPMGGPMGPRFFRARSGGRSFLEFRGVAHGPWGPGGGLGSPGGPGVVGQVVVANNDGWTSVAPLLTCSILDKIESDISLKLSKASLAYFLTHKHGAWPIRRG